MILKMRPNFASLEDVLKRMGDEPGYGAKLLIGGALCFVPILHLIALGYLFRYARSIRISHDLGLPDWDDWGELVRDGLRTLVVWLVFFLLPVLVGLLLWSLFARTMPEWMALRQLSWLFFAAGVVTGCSFFMAALYRFAALNDLGSMLDFSTIWRMAFAMRWQLALPIVFFIGAWAIFWPLYGFVFFFGFLILTAYSTLSYLLMERAAGIHR